MSARTVRIEPFTPHRDPNKRQGVVWYQIAMGGGVYYRDIDDEYRDHPDGTTKRSYGSIWSSRRKARRAAESMGFTVLS